MKQAKSKVEIFSRLMILQDNKYRNMTFKTNPSKPSSNTFKKLTSISISSKVCLQIKGGSGVNENIPVKHSHIINP